MENRLERIIKLKLDNFEIKYPKKNMEDAPSLEEKNPCWAGYEPVGTKMVDGREVPNCVPIENKKVKEGFPVPSPSGDESESDFVGRCMKEIGNEYEQEQALAICYNKYKGK